MYASFLLYDFSGSPGGQPEGGVGHPRVGLRVTLPFSFAEASALRSCCTFMKFTLQAPLGVRSDRSRDSKIFAFPCVLFPSAFCARAFLACLLLSGPSCVRLLGERLI